MKIFTPAISTFVCAALIFCSANKITAQTLKLTDFAVWGGSGSASSYNSSQGVFIGNAVAIQGNIGSNHRVDAKNLFSLTGNIYSGNTVFFGNIGKVTGNVFAAKSAGNYTGNVITGDYKISFTGNLTAKGKIVLKNFGSSNATTVKGQVAVPAPSSANYSGPQPTGGIVNTLSFPVLPSMPNNSAFDNQAGVVNITNTQIISPGKYKKLALPGNKTLTFNGPGNYIFYEVDNALNTNKMVFDFKNSTTGAINIFIIKDAKWGRLSVSTKNGNFPSRIYTEIHGTGSTNEGNTFSLVGPVSIPAGSNIWLGNVWAPNGGISIKSLNPFNAPHIIGALWSGKKVELDQNLKLVYQAPAVGTVPGFISPYYAPPANGKVSAANNKVGAELTALAQNPAPITSSPNNDIFITDANSRVMIEVISKDPHDATLRSQLIALGMRDASGASGTIDNGPDVYVISGYFPIASLSQLNNNTRIEYVRPLYPPISNTGIVTSQGDVTMRSDAVRSRFGLDGSGVKIGVISDSYNAKLGADADVNEDDLPGVKSNGQPNDNPIPVQVVQDLVGKGNDEGRAMLQIVHDVAPMAKLAFNTGFLSAGQFAKAIQTLASPTLPGGGCHIIVDDLTYITEPFQTDGVVAQTVNQVVSQGVSYFSSAGNFGNKSYEAIFNGVTNTSVMPVGQIHKFGAGASDIYQTLNLKPGSYTIALQWSDEFSSLGSVTGVQTDLDLYLVDANGFQLFGFNRSNLFGDPFEICAFTVQQETNAKLMIVRAAGTSNVRFKYIIFRGDGTIMDYPSGASSLVGHPNADSAIAVGAMLYANIPGITPVWPGVASFSSRGGTFTKPPLGTSFSQRNKPELIGPNGVNTTVNLGGAPFNDGDTYPNFFGTSAAAPHVAAVAALVLQGRKKFSQQAAVKPFEIRRQLVSSAGKFSYLTGNFSYEGGYGYVQADSAIQQIANPKPIISSLQAVVPGAQSGTDPFAVKVQGKYFTSATKIYVDQQPITTTVTIDPATGIGTAIATIPAIPAGGDPLFQLYNSPKSVSNLDGGFSEGLQFFKTGIKILVKATDRSRRYGQENPPLTAQVSVVIGSDTSDISQTSLTLADLKLDNLSLATNAVPFSSPRSYGISVARTTPLAGDDSLLTKYSFQFLPGTMTVQKMTLKITPNIKRIQYGDELSGISYNYDLDQNGVVSPGLPEEVRSLHEKYLADNGLIVINGLSPSLSSADLDQFVNMSTLASFQSVLNARKFTVVNGQLKALIDNIPISRIGDQRFMVDVSAQSLQNYIANNTQSALVRPLSNSHSRGVLNLKSLIAGDAKASASGNFVPMVNGQLLAMVNGPIQALLNGQVKAPIDGILKEVVGLSFQNGQLLALADFQQGVWTPVPSGQILATVNGQQVTVDLSVANGQLAAVANGQPMSPASNGELQATINGQLFSLANGQLKAMVNGQLTPLVNGQVTAIVNGQLQPLTNGQLVAIVNGQIMILENGELEVAEDLSLINGQLKALVNGQLKALVNGQLKAMVNGVITDVAVSSFSLVNGQLRALVNGQQVAYVNGELLVLENGQLKALVNGSGIVADSIRLFANGQLKALVNGSDVPIDNGQLQAVVNGQLLEMVNGQLMAVVNGQVTFVVFQNGQLKALVNGQMQPFINGQLKAVVNGDLEDVNSTTIVNGQLRAIVNGETWVYPNGQLKALVNGEIQPLENNFDVSGANNNTKTVVLVDEDDVNLQFGDVGGMFSMNMITGLDAGTQYLIPGAFVNENFEVTYGYGEVQITKKLITVSADHKTKNAGDPNPPLTVSYNGLAFDETPDSLVRALVFPPATKSIDQNERRTTYTGVTITGTSNQNDTPNVYYAVPGESLSLTANYSETHFLSLIPGYQAYCPTCVTQNYVGMSNSEFTANQFSTCLDVSYTGPHSGIVSATFTAPSRPGVYYITQKCTWWNVCYQFGQLLHDQIPGEAIAVVIVNPAAAITANTTATQASPEGDYPIVVGGTVFNPNYRIIYVDSTLTIGPGTIPQESFLKLDDEAKRAGKPRVYPNPATGSVKLVLNNEVSSIHSIQIFDATGTLISTIGKKQVDGIYEINVSGLKAGLYFLQAKTNTGIKTFKFVKL